MACEMREHYLHCARARGRKIIRKSAPLPRLYTHFECNKYVCSHEPVRGDHMSRARALPATVHISHAATAQPKSHHNARAVFARAKQSKQSLIQRDESFTRKIARIRARRVCVFV